MKTCISCGMPMEKEADFPKGDMSLSYCVHCARPDGTMQSFEEKKGSLKNFIIKTQGFDPTAAEEAAEHMMRRLPAWKASFKEDA